MKICFLAPAFIIALALGASALLAQPAARSAKSGVFSAAQADRGRSVILSQCAGCHSPTLLGGQNNEPPLVGKPFQEKWAKMSLNDLFEKIVTTMPADNPGHLSKSEYIDALAYILSANNYPAGAQDLSSDRTVLTQITITP